MKKEEALIYLVHVSGDEEVVKYAFDDMKMAFAKLTEILDATSEDDPGYHKVMMFQGQEIAISTPSRTYRARLGDQEFDLTNDKHKFEACDYTVPTTIIKKSEEKADEQPTEGAKNE